MGSPGAVAGRPGDEDFRLESAYEVKEKIGEGTYGTVYKANDRQTGARVAIKRIKFGDEDEGVPATALREISLLKECEHPNVIRLRDVHSSSSSLYLVFDCLDMDLRAFLKRVGPLKDPHLRSAAYQCFSAVEHCHGRRILHRDLKPQNVLVDMRSFKMVLGDFGLARAFSAPLKVYTHEVVTLWYRAPEVLLGQSKYGPGVDIWSLGCILAEMATQQALFPGDSEIDTLFKMFQKLSTPSEETWPGVSTLIDFKPNFPKWQDTSLADVRAKGGCELGEDGMELLFACLAYNPVARPSAQGAMRFAFFQAGQSSQWRRTTTQLI